jgi:CRP-like cAMP-binding protein
MADAQNALEMMITRFEKRAPLSDNALAALRGLPFELNTYPKHAHLIREGERVKSAKLIVEGLAYRHKVTAEGARQILSLHMRGDFVDLEGSLLNVADHNVQVLETCTVAEVPRAALLEVIDRHGALAHAMWVDTLIDASVYREWIVNVGRRDARRAMCHLLCEFGRRLEFAGLANGGRYELPMNQEQLADALGITPVHVNRVLKELDKEGLILRQQRSVQVPDRKRLADVGGFNELYLHLDLLAEA